jgi:hypothetical protein
MSIRVWVPYLVNTKSTRQWKELNMVEESASNYFHPTWKLAFHTMVTKVLRMTSWILVCSLPWVQCMKWIHARSMWCVHTHQTRPKIKGCDTPNHIENIVEKTNENNWKDRNIGWIISQTPTPRAEHGKIWARWALSFLSKSMWVRAWWSKCFEMESWSWTICCLRNYSKGKRYTHVGGVKKFHIALGCC